MEELKGSIVALVTPFHQNIEQSVNFNKLAELVEFHVENNTSAIVTCGTTGEAPTLLKDEWEMVISTVIDVAKNSNVKVIPGTGSYSTKEAVKLTESAANLGADACLVVTPYYNKPTIEGLLAHFEELDKVGIPLILYNIPSRTGMNVDPDTVLRLCERCSSLIGLKASNGDLDQITEVAYKTSKIGRKFSILSGDDSLTVPILSIGGSGVISVAANFMPKVINELVDTYSKSNIDTSKFIMHSIHPFCQSLLKLGSNPAPIKTVMNYVGMNVGTCRKPLVGISSENAEKLFQIIHLLKNNLESRGISYDKTLLSF